MEYNQEIKQFIQTLPYKTQSCIVPALMKKYSISLTEANSLWIEFREPLVQNKSVVF